MASKESLYPKDWIKKADKDFERVKERIDSDVEDAAFHLQQAVEKYLKAYLLLKGWKLKKIHDLEALLDEAVKYNTGFEKFRKLCQRITGYYLIERYPFILELPSKQEVKSELTQAKRLSKAILKEIKKV